MRSSGTPAARAASYEHSSTRRGLVDVDVGAHALRVREAHHAVVGRDGADLLGRVRGARPRVRVVGRDRGEPRPQLAHVPLVLVDAAAGRGAQRGLEQRVHHRAARPRSARHLVLARAGPVVADHPLARRVVAGLPRELDARLAARPPARVHRSRRRRSSTTSQLVALDPRRANSLTSSCGLLPPTVDTRGRARLDAELARRAARRDRGSGHEPIATTADHVDAVEQRAAWRRRRRRRARHASASRSIGRARLGGRDPLRRPARRRR